MSKRKHTHARRKSNTRLFSMLGAVLVIALIAAAVIYFNSNPPPAQGLAAEITVDEAYAKYQAGAFLLDVRTQEEWDQYHIPNTTLIPLDQLPDRLNEVPRDKEIVVVCRSGNRSQQGRDILLSNGFARVTSMAGGVNEWSGKNHPIEGTRP